MPFQGIDAVSSTAGATTKIKRGYLIMAYIYKITNNINGKIYIGKTEFSIEKRFKEHCQDAFKPSLEKRPLYAAMRKYGIDNFSICLIEETSEPEERESFWIEQTQSFKNGYNATLGGDGRKYLDYDVLVATYLETKSIAKTAEICHCDDGHLSDILKSRGVHIFTQQEVNIRNNGKCINQYDLQDNYIQTFATAREAARFVRPNSTSIGGVASHITDVCRGSRKTAYGYKWSFSGLNYDITTSSDV